MLRRPVTVVPVVRARPLAGCRWVQKSPKAAKLRTTPINLGRMRQDLASNYVEHLRDEEQRGGPKLFEQGSRFRLKPKYPHHP